MVRDLQIAQARRDGGGQSCDRQTPVNQWCIWCDLIGHARRDCADFGEALRSNVIYLSNGRIHASDMRRMLDVNFGWGGMKRLMEGMETKRLEVSCSFTVGGIWCIFFIKDAILKKQLPACSPRSHQLCGQAQFGCRKSWAAQAHYSYTYIANVDWSYMYNAHY